MEIDATPLRADRRAALERSFLVPVPEDVADHGSYTGPVAVRARLRNEDGRILAEIEAHARCEVPCDRCLQPVAFPLDVRYTEEFVTPEQAARDGIEGVEQDDGEVRVVVYRDDRIVLDPGLWQNLALAMPGKHLCREDCRGLCPRCGRNLNEGDCACGSEADPGDPRLHALAEAMRRMNGTPRQGG
ncbi:MAG TPA: DUF177 domain-containing protein [Bacillota bacterium]|nr:DUF177 domain-containing protein [Bacillota bacterium]